MKKTMGEGKNPPNHIDLGEKYFLIDRKYESYISPFLL